MTSRLLLDDDDNEGLANSTSRYTLCVIFGICIAGSMITTSPPATAVKGRVRIADVSDWMTKSRRRCCLEWLENTVAERLETEPRVDEDDEINLLLMMVALTENASTTKWMQHGRPTTSRSSRIHCIVL